MPHETAYIKIFYLAAAILFVFGIKDLSHPRTAVRGNLLASLGMLIAIVVTLLDTRILENEVGPYYGYGVILAGFVIGGLVGAFMAYRSPMTAMPQVVAVFNGFGGGASALAVGAALEEAIARPGQWIEEITIQFTLSAALAALIGGVALTGSFIAFGKLQGLIEEKPVLLPHRHKINIALVVVCVLLIVWLSLDSLPLFNTDGQFASPLHQGVVSKKLRQAFRANGRELSDDVTVHLKSSDKKVDVVEQKKHRSETSRWRVEDKTSGVTYTLLLEGDRLYVTDPIKSWPFWLLVIFACVLGVMVVIPIGGADMPVVVSLLNAYSGIAAAGHGWVLNNSVLIIAGSLVGAAGFILTALMSKAMNRSLANIMFAGVGAKVASTEEADDIYAGRVKSASPEEVALLMQDAQRVVIVPGYGMAVAQAQHAIQELTSTLEKLNVEVEFGIHPVAGRMPGHMNVLLADANVSYDKMQEMDVINPTFKQTDVAVVIGANDVVNPQARESDPSIPIAGMPILDVDQARSVVVIKRSLSPGFAGIPNPLFASEKTLMLFGDAKQMVTELNSALKESL